MARSGSSIHSREENQFTEQQEEYPLEVASSIQATPSIMERRNPLEDVHNNHDPDEPPPPYEEFSGTPADAPQIAPVEYSCDNSPQLIAGSEPYFPEPPPRNPARLSSQFPEVRTASTPGSPPGSPDPSLVPAPLQLRPTSSSGRIPRRPLPPRSPQTTSTFSSAKAREAGFEIQQPLSPRRSGSSSSFPSVHVLPSTEPLHYSREPTKVTAYLVPFPKPRLRGVKPEDIPDRFLIYTPPLPPLSKPAPGEKESHLHKTQRLWQEDVRKAMMNNASKATWKGMKARTTSLIHKGVNATRSSNVEFLDRVSGGAITSTAQNVDAQESTTQITDAPLSSEPSSTTPSEQSFSTTSLSQTSSTTSTDKDHKPRKLEDLTLIYPPSLQLSPDKVRTEFVDSLMRTREKSRKEAFVASALLPFAATIDAALIVTFGGLTQVSGVWAYTSTRGVLTSTKLTKGLARGEQQAHEHAETETRGCTCGHHEADFGHPEIVTKQDKKGKKKGINLQLQQSTHLEILRRYLDLACLKNDFNMFPQIEEAAGDVNEESVLEAIGWKPVPRFGRDLEIEFKDRVEAVTSEQDMLYQTKEAKDDVKRYMRKGAAEWIAWCKSFQKDPEAALKK